MSYDIEPGGRHIPTLVQYCQRVACAHVENICSLGEGLRYDLIRPVLESCTPDTLLRFEQNDPYIAKDTSDIWKGLLWREFPIAAHQYETQAIEEPESWREELFALREQEQQRLEQLSVRLKASRQEEEERKRDSAIKLTDKLPPAKRARQWGAPSQPKTLFQKTKSETARLQKGVFGSRYARPSHQTQRIVPHTASAKPPPPSTSGSAFSGSRVVVRSVPVTQKPLPPKQPPVTPTKVATTKPRVSSTVFVAPHAAQSPPVASSPPPAASSPPPPSSPPDNRPAAPRTTAKKNPGSSLFMPKHRAYSQLPRGVQSKS
ncbi:RNA polymerase II transcription factor SIII subunit A-domain-containing protein [Earliella scabrosa]|nr:RNA polymerase II transcription factor SIII subunit A-domain-containing protein [Earliella scabrosa]